jgi:hypothetical protein
VSSALGLFKPDGFTTITFFSFPLNHSESINELSGTAIPLHFSLQMCTTAFHVVQPMIALEARHAPRARAYPLIIESTNKLETVR